MTRLIRRPNNRHLDSAQHDLEKAVQAYPQFAEAWYQLGKVDEVLKPQDAWPAYSKAAAADPLFSPPYEHLAQLAAQQKKWQEVVDATDKASEAGSAGYSDHLVSQCSRQLQSRQQS